MNAWHLAALILFILSLISGYRAGVVQERRVEATARARADLQVQQFVAAVSTILERPPDSWSAEELEDIRARWAEASDRDKPDLVLDYLRRDTEAQQLLRDRTPRAERAYESFLSRISELASQYDSERLRIELEPLSGLPGQEWTGIIEFTEREREELYFFLATPNQGDFPELRLRVTSGTQVTYLHMTPVFERNMLAITVAGDALHHFPSQMPSELDLGDAQGIQRLAWAVLEYELARLAAIDQRG